MGNRGTGGAATVTFGRRNDLLGGPFPRTFDHAKG
jgi:hypothetical protein